MQIVAALPEPVRARSEPAADETAFRLTTWQEELRLAIRDVSQLATLLELPAEVAEAAGRVSQSFRLFVPRPFLARIKRGDIADPLLRQVWPLEAEAISPEGFAADPVGDEAAALSPGLLQKYSSRALLVTTGACAVHCRYCFRRHFPYADGPRSPAQWQPAIDRIAADPSIDEVLLSGGDPLTLVDSHLADLAERLSKIPHVRRLRIHTRLPIMIPQRVTQELLGWLRGTRLTPVMVIHANHAQEIDAPVAEAISKLADAGIPLLNQAVLLRNVNDSTTALIELSRRLVDLRVIPYYLHQLDRVQGAAHFEVPVSRGRELLNAMRQALPGYATPRYVQEIPGEPHKRVLA